MVRSTSPHLLTSPSSYCIESDTQPDMEQVFIAWITLLGFSRVPIKIFNVSVFFCPISAA